MALTTQQIAEWTVGRVEGPAQEFSALEAMDRAAPGQLTFVGQAPYAKALAGCPASGALCTEGLQAPRREDQTIIWVKNADLAVAQVLEKIAPPWPAPEIGVHPTAVIDPAATLGRDVRIGPHVTVQAGAVIGDRSVLMAGVFIGADARVGPDCFLWSNVTVRERCTLGQRVILHPGCVIGADGFGYRFDKGRHVKIPQIGTVEIGDDCELGANTCVDRGKFSATVVGAGCKLDNLVQIGHNVTLGRHSILVAHTAIGGSTRTGDYLVMGGAAVIADHVTVGAGVQLAAMSALNSAASDGQKLAGTPAKEVREVFADMRAMHQVPRWIQTVQDLQKRVAALESATKDHREGS